MNDPLPTPPLQTAAAEPPPPPDDPPASDVSNSLEGLLVQITSQDDYEILNHMLRIFAPIEVRETILGSLLPGGADPLQALDVKRNTLGILYLLSARLQVNAAAAPPPQFIEAFCQDFDPEQARLAPERVTFLAKGILQLGQQANEAIFSVKALADLLVRFPPSLHYLTPLHALFMTACVANRLFASATPILSESITEIDIALFPDLHYTDNLVYHYAGGFAYAALNQWEEAEEFFEIVVGAPAQVPSAIQLEAGKKLILVQLIKDGKSAALPRYTNPNLQRLLKNTPYFGLNRHYPQQQAQLRILIEKEKETFEKDQNIGLVKLMLEHAPRWAIKKLTGTYLTLSIPEIGKAISMEGQDEAVQRIILSMIEKGEIDAWLSMDGIVTFNDSPPTVPTRILTRTEIDVALKEAQRQAAILSALEREIGKSRDFLVKAARVKDNDWVGPGVPDEDLMFGVTPSGSWAEDA
ncbi:hypothetical protein NEOLEDRAFT_1182185 [Neolentinus lepideus HHB14362 ss-1]|uniref:COP9 signalosome complex subunit 3 n=1 Tax=Neolentinus lepideus HHB14362 ss-1 TaxID=1314782 RepID=A0A165PCX7_9AGAM|nr:hypothetical protein NEOLEDRAFT_1182185 [Neolentinus lepideus HHB14362 ss-1]